MILFGTEAGPFNDALRTLTHFWRVNDAELALDDSSPVVLVDLQHEDMNLIFGCLTAAKYVQRETNAQLVGLIGHSALCTVISDGLYDIQRVQDIARGFGVDTFLRLDAQGLYEFCEGRPEVVEMITTEMARLDADLDVRDGLVDMARLASFATADGVPIGNYTADTVVRILIDPTPDSEALGLVRLMAMDCLQIKAAVEWIAATSPVAAYVTSHMVFTNWATASHVLAARGVNVVLIGHEASGFQIDIVATPPEPGKPVYAKVSEGRAAVLDAIVEDDTAARRGLCRKVGALASSPDILGASRWNIDAAGDLDRSADSALRAQARERLGIVEANAETVFVVAHCFSDAPRSEPGLFDDYWAWMCWTLDRAVDIPEKNWVVRFHPFSATYREHAVLARFIERYGRAENVFFDNRLLSKDEFFSLCDVAVTVRGTLGHELVRHGIPVVVAGSSAYSRGGFVHAPADLDEYEKLLRLPASSLPELPDAADRARAWTMLVTVGAGTQSAYVPLFAEHPWDFNFAQIARAYRSTMLEFDPGSANFARAWRDGLPLVVNGDLWGAVDDSTPPRDRTTDRLRLESWAIGEEGDVQ
ncbi:MAG: hypothetical protein AB7L13_09925 [Acidimicrobiia bacterium]